MRTDLATAVLCSLAVLALIVASPVQAIGADTAAQVVAEESLPLPQDLHECLGQPALFVPSCAVQWALSSVNPIVAWLNELINEYPEYLALYVGDVILALNAYLLAVDGWAICTVVGPGPCGDFPAPVLPPLPELPDLTPLE